MTHIGPKTIRRSVAVRPYRMGGRLPSRGATEGMVVALKAFGQHRFAKTTYSVSSTRDAISSKVGLRVL
jgi:hypothetical protein